MSTNDYKTNPLYNNIRAWTGRLLFYKGNECSTLPNLNIGNGLEVVEDIALSQSHTLCLKPNFEFYEHSGSQTITSSVNYMPLQINGQKGTYNSSNLFWNTGSNVFTPKKLNQTYIIRVSGRITPVNSNPIVQVDFNLSGSTNPLIITNLKHHQSWEQSIKNNVDHVHVQAIFPVFVDNDLYVSGGQIYVNSDSVPLTFVSAAVMIIEG